MVSAERRDPTRFVLLATQRSGTGYLGTLLSSIPGVRCAAELCIAGEAGLQPGNFYAYWAERVRQEPAALLPTSMTPCVGGYLERAFADDGERAVGFNVKYNQLNELRMLKSCLRRAGARILHMLRGNVLKAYVSREMNVRQAALGRKSHGTRPVPPRTLELDAARLPGVLDACVAEVDARRREFRTGFDVLEVGYEECLSGRGGEDGASPEVLARVCAFLGVPEPVERPTTRLVKTNPDDLRGSIANFDAVREALADTRYAHLLEEGGPGWNPGGLPLPGYVSAMSLRRRLRLREAVHRASALVADGREDAALERLGELVEWHDLEPDVLAAWALVQERTGAARRAREAYARILSLDPAHAGAAQGLARLERAVAGRA